MSDSSDALSRIEKELPKETIFDSARRFLDAYCPYFSRYRLERGFAKAFRYEPACFSSDIWGLSNALMLHYYHNEAFVKYRFVESELADGREVSAFEVPVGQSRADLCRIGSRSECYEIKTAYDKLDRLAKQLQDYSSVFEYVYVVCPESRLDEILPLIGEEIGIYTYDDRRKNTRFRQRRRASRSTAIDPTKQIQCALLQEEGNADPEQINAAFKAKYIRRYAKNWTFLCDHRDQIYPLDYQWSFKYKAVPHR